MGLRLIWVREKKDGEQVETFVASSAVTLTNNTLLYYFVIVVVRYSFWESFANIYVLHASALAAFATV